MSHKTKQTYSSRVGMMLLMLVSLYLFFNFLGHVINGLRPLPRMTFGASFSAEYARALGFDPREMYTALLDDLKIRALRIPAYWNELEPNSDEFNFEELDWLINEASKRQAKIILAIGLRLPRWPECHAPAWARSLPPDKREIETLKLLQTIVARYRSNSTIVSWQVENEPLLEIFGQCPKPSREFLKKETAIVRSLDNRPIIITESGELSTWLRTVGISDVLGISMYRVSWNIYLGYVFYPLTPGFYRFRADLVRPYTRKVIVSELQAEPWVPRWILDTTLEEQSKSMNPERLRENISFVQQAGFNEAYLWGVEWWYWLKNKQNDSSMWDLGREIFSHSAPPPVVY